MCKILRNMMGKMWEKHLLKPILTIVCVIVIVVGIGVISIIFGDGVTWSDLLLYAGSAIGGCAALIAIVISSYQNSRAYQQNEKYHQRSVMPFLILEPIDIINVPDPFAPSAEDMRDLFSGYDKIITIEAGDNPTPILSNDITRYSHVPLVLFSRYYYRRFTIRNIGADSAYDIKIIMQDKIIVEGWALTKNGDIVSFLTIDNTHDGMINTPSENYKINITMEYCDLEGRRYKQVCSCEVNQRPLAHVAAPKTTLPELI